jgi:hypothetical protein
VGGPLRVHGRQGHSDGRDVASILPQLAMALPRAVVLEAEGVWRHGISHATWSPSSLVSAACSLPPEPRRDSVCQMAPGAAQASQGNELAS